MISRHSHRKNEHVSLAKKYFSSKATAGFDQVRFIHHSLPEVTIDQINPTSHLFSNRIKLKWPFYIEAMTGGSNETGRLNQKLARIARITNLAMASGSESVALKDPQTVNSFKVIRDELPSGIIFGNIGAGHNVSDVNSAINILAANALELHVNVAQEMIMPEGDRHFKWQDELATIVHNADAPIIIKEVGFGMDQQTLDTLVNVIGAQAINISGRGGTNFALIENFRRTNKDMDYLNEWGQTTVESLLEAQSFKNRVDIIASGGIRNPLDIAKAISLGANAVGVAGTILNKLIQDGEESTIQMIKDWQQGLITIMTMLGCQTIDRLQSEKLLLSPELINYTKQRSIKY